MAKWLRSGLRRDVCVLVAGMDGPTGQQLKRELEAHYDDRIRPAQFYGALDELVDDGHLDREQAGLADRYELTAAGREALESHAAWVAEHV